MNRNGLSPPPITSDPYDVAESAEESANFEQSLLESPPIEEPVSFLKSSPVLTQEIQFESSKKQIPAMEMKQSGFLFFCAVLN